MLEATFVITKWGMNLNEKDHVDICCRTFHKCDAHKRDDLNVTTELYVRHCDCIHSFQLCLQRANTSLSNEFAFMHSINSTRCYGSSTKSGIS